VSEASDYEARLDWELDAILEGSDVCLACLGLGYGMSYVVNNVGALHGGPRPVVCPECHGTKVRVGEGPPASA
jgi:hypothetical protein